MIYACIFLCIAKFNFCKCCYYTGDYALQYLTSGARGFKSGTTGLVVCFNLGVTVCQGIEGFKSPTCTGLVAIF